MDWWAYENEALEAGWRILCGVDEAGAAAWPVPYTPPPSSCRAGL
jgi:hypothetical protein